ncbi:probable inactive receptor kinase At4g23740 [Rutidosis leptorrhynchoides]|uniref:probable inactive receptor kinase At4g23740 n=1 Tax=Rutidosis leptorrhynchoides TaxID=125765 RepID=UPI003A9A1060
MEIFKFFLMGLLWFGANALVLEDDKRALLDFMYNFPHSRSLNWDSNTVVCNLWTGVTCSEDGSRVIGLRLPGVGFHGHIPANTISRLSALQILSLRSNGISGPFPDDFYNLKNLSLLYLQFNEFTGPLPLDFTVWNNFTIVNLSNNKFNGSIPSSISNLTHLSALNLANNLLIGQIPDLGIHSLQVLNLSNNHLSGVVPKSLHKFPKSVFIGNNVSIMYSSDEVPIVMPTHKPNPSSKNSAKLSEKALLGIIVAVVGVGFTGLAIFWIMCCLKRNSEDGISSKLEKGGMSPEKAISRTQDANNRLVFFEGCNYAFDLEDLLRASAEVLGKGTFGMSYKAILEDGTSVVVKRLKELSVGKREFEQQMGIVGSIKHENVIELRAYYYSKDEKLTVCEYYSQGSVAAMLHGKRGEDRVPLTWETRIQIAIGAARGIARVHAETGGKLVHGNIKSSNIFLNSQNYGCISDIGLSTIMAQIATPIARAAGYRAPEITDTRKVTQASDVYSFGVLLLELLTGKSPVHTTSGDEVIHLVRWVHSVVREEWTGEVFDVELLKYPNIEEQMVEMLQIAMSCVARVADQRPKMGEVVKMVEDVRRNMDPRSRPESSMSSRQEVFETESSGQ